MSFGSMAGIDLAAVLPVRDHGGEARLVRRLVPGGDRPVLGAERPRLVQDQRPAMPVPGHAGDVQLDQPPQPGERVRLGSSTSRRLSSRSSS